MILYNCPAVSAIVPVFTVGPWSVQLSTIVCPFTNKRTPSSEFVEKVYVPVVGGRTWPAQRTLNWSRPTPPKFTQVPAESVKFTLGSIRVKAIGAERNGLA